MQQRQILFRYANHDANIKFFTQRFEMELTWTLPHEKGDKPGRRDTVSFCMARGL